MMNYKVIILTVLCVFTAACDYRFPEPIPQDSLDPGTADFNQIVVLGDGLGAGFMDGSLYSESQENSIGVILTDQINLHNVTPIEFNQPDINSIHGYNPGYSGMELAGKSFLTFISPGESQLFKDANPGELPETYTGPALNNFSVPFLRTPQVLDPALNTNLYYQRFATDPGNSALIDQVILADPTMAIIQLGWHDILAYAMGGLTGNPDPDPDDIQPVDLTPEDLFRDSYTKVVELLLQDTGAEIVLTNIPDVSQFPFFNSISTPAFITGEEVEFLASFYSDYNIQVSKSNINQDILRPIIQFFGDDPPHLWKAVVDDPALVDRIQEDGSSLPKYRQMEEGEYILWSTPQLPTLAGEGLGTTQPLPKSLFFTKNDVAEVRDLVERYNRIIADIAGSNNRLHLLDWFSITEQWIEDGIIFDGVQHTYDFNRSGIFSSDGINLNSRGSALFTNQLIEFINLQFNSNITLVDANVFPGNVFVNDF